MGHCYDTILEKLDVPKCFPIAENLSYAVYKQNVFFRVFLNMK